MSLMLNYHRVSLISLSCLILDLFVASGVHSQATAELPEKEKLKIIEGAKKERRIIYYTGMDLEDSEVFRAEFEKRYRFIKVEAFRSSGERVLTKFLTESRAGTYHADVFQTSIIQVYQLKKQGLLQRYISPESRVYPQGFKDSEGQWNAFYLLTYVMGYNTKLVSPTEAPKSYEELLKPKWRGKIGLEMEEYQWFYHVLRIMGKEKGLAFMEKLSQQDLQIRKGHSLLAQLVVAGEIPLAVVLYGHQVESLIAKGAPVNWVRSEGPTITAINAISIAEKAPHPNASRLFVDFALSKDGQEILRRFHRIPARPDVYPDPPGLTEGLNLYPARPEGLVESYKDTAEQFDQIFIKKRQAG